MVRKDRALKIEKKLTGFEKLVQSKNSAREKKIKKAEKYFNQTKDSEIMKLADINNRRVKKKFKKKNLFDLESDEEEMQDL